MGHINSNDVKGFLLNFFAVVLGIAITFWCEAMVSARKEKAEVNASLTLVANELKDNIEYLHVGDNSLNNYSKAATFLSKYMSHYENAPSDSLDMYCNIPLIVTEVSASEDALDLMKSSSIFTKIKDAELSLDIIRTYGVIQDRMILFKMIFDMCGSYRNDALTQEVKEVLAGSSLNAVTLWNAITASTAGRQFVREFREVSIYADSSDVENMIDELVSRIEEYVKKN